MSNNTLDQSNQPQDEPVSEPQDAPLNIGISEAEKANTPAQDVGSPTSKDSNLTVDLDEL
jgi:hypothetical protein